MSLLWYTFRFSITVILFGVFSAALAGRGAGVAAFLCASFGIAIMLFDGYRTARRRSLIVKRKSK